MPAIVPRRRRVGPRPWPPGPAPTAAPTVVTHGRRATGTDDRWSAGPVAAAALTSVDGRAGHLHPRARRQRPAVAPLAHGRQLGRLPVAPPAPRGGGAR